MNNRYSNSCGCEQPGMAPVSAAGSSKSLAMAYVPWQKWQNVMDGCNALKHGTIFEELALSFKGTKAACGPMRYDNRRNNNNYYRRGMK